MVRLREGRADGAPPTSCAGGTGALRRGQRTTHDARADSGFYAHAVVAVCRKLDVRFSITIRQHARLRNLIEAIPEADFPYWMDGAADVAETTSLSKRARRRAGAHRPEGEAHARLALFATYSYPTGTATPWISLTIVPRMPSATCMASVSTISRPAVSPRRLAGDHSRLHNLATLDVAPSAGRARDETLRRRFFSLAGRLSSARRLTLAGRWSLGGPAAPWLDCFRSLPDGGAGNRPATLPVRPTRAHRPARVLAASGRHPHRYSWPLYAGSIPSPLEGPFPAAVCEAECLGQNASARFGVADAGLDYCGPSGGFHGKDAACSSPSRTLDPRTARLGAPSRGRSWGVSIIRLCRVASSGKGWGEAASQPVSVLVHILWRRPLAVLERPGVRLGLRRVSLLDAPLGFPSRGMVLLPPCPVRRTLRRENGAASPSRRSAGSCRRCIRFRRLEPP